MPREPEDQPFEDPGFRWVHAGFFPPDEPGRATERVLKARAIADPRPPAGPRDRRVAVAAMLAPPMARHDWLPMGPRNVAGRVRALAVTPGRPDVWYAGSATGGVHVSTDHGATWRRVWTGEPSLSIGAIAVAPHPADPAQDRVYVATGEVLDVPGHGLWVSDRAGAAGSWRVGNPPPPDPVYDGGFEALTAHPTARDHAWAVGVNGAFRTLDGGSTWTQLDAGTHWTDAHFASDGRLCLARGGRFDEGGAITGRAVLVRLSDPATATTASLSDAANVSTILQRPADGTSWPAAVKFAIAPSRETLIYARVVDDRRLGRHIGIFRTTRADRPANDFRWERLADADDFHDEDQGIYDLCIVVHPLRPELVATGMTDLFVTRNGTSAAANVTWLQAMDWRLHDHGLRAHHADHHQLVAVGDELWVADDGGISRCADWNNNATTGVPSRPPLPPSAFVWANRDDGISASQFYDLNQSPLVPGLVAGGFQDNGTYATASGGSWRVVNGADGGFATFDPDDPYTMLVTTQSSIDRVGFAAHRDLQFPDEQPPGPPPGSRSLTDGFRDFDPPRFVADTVRHATDRSRVLNARSGRLYGLRGSGAERWDVEPVGRGLDLVVTAVDPAATRLRVTVVDTAGAHRLGLVPGPTTATRFDDPDLDRVARPLIVQLTSYLPAPYAMRAGDEVRLRVEGEPNDHVVAFTAAAAADLAAMTLSEVIALFRAAAVPGLEALPRLWDTPTGIELVVQQTAPATVPTIRLDGSAFDTADVGTTQLHGLSRLGLNRGTYSGRQGQPLSVTLAGRSRTLSDARLQRSFPGGPQTLSISVNGVAAPLVTIAPPAFPDPQSITLAELAAALRTSLTNLPVTVVVSAATKAVRLVADAGRSFSCTGTAAARLGLRPIPSVDTTIRVDPLWADGVGLHRRNHNTVDLEPPDPATPLVLQISDGANSVTVTFDGAGVANRRCVTIEELHQLLATALGAAAPPLRVSLEFVSFVRRGGATEIAWSTAEPDHVWIGTADGLVERSTDQGATWQTSGRGTLDLADASVEAIALHPTDHRIAYVGTWRPTDVPVHHAQLHRTDDAGASWQPRGIEVDGHEVSIRAIELHPDDPTVVFAATDHGVFWSQDEGRSWSPFSEGLPSCQVMDLAVDRSGPTLVAATWGAGAYRRAIGTSPPDDVRLHLRASELDLGGDRPVAGDPNPFSLTSASARAASPDIKVVRGPVPAIADGVVFDLDTPSEPIATDVDASVLVQVHNRGSQPAASGPAPADPKVRVVVLRTGVIDTVPDLAPDFFTRFRAGGIVTDVIGAWHVLADLVLPAPLTVDHPLVVGATIDGAARTKLAIVGPAMGVLALVSSADDEITGGHTEIDKLLASDRRVAYREVPVVRQFEDNRIVLQATGGEPIQIVDIAPDRRSRAAPDLRFTTLGPDRRLVADPAPPAATAYDLSGVDRHLVIAQPIARTSMTFDNSLGEFLDVTAARPAEVAAFIQRRIELAGLPLFCVPSDDHLRFRALGDATVEVRGGTATGGPRLVFTPAGPQPMVTAPNEVALPFDGTIDLRVRALGRTDDITLTLDDGRSWRHADVLNRQLDDAGFGGIVVAETTVGLFIGTQGRDDHRVRFTLSGTALAALGLPAGEQASAGIGLAPVNVDGRVLDIDVAHEVRVRFPKEVAVAPTVVRRAINDAVAAAGMFVRAEPAVVRLHVGASSTDPGLAPARTGSAALADIVTSGTVVAIPPDALFETRTRLGTDALSAGVANHVYVRVANRGNVATTSGRVRLFVIGFGTPTVTPTFSAGTPQDVPAAAIEHADVTHTPTAAAGAVEIVLAVADEDADGRRVDPPATWANRHELTDWVAAHAGAAIRRFDVVP
jgi:photosystem II stability/assembly factor-like uncharacterized protein